AETNSFGPSGPAFDFRRYRKSETMRVRGGFLLTPPGDDPFSASRRDEHRRLHPIPGMVVDTAAGDPTIERGEGVAVFGLPDLHLGLIVIYGVDGAANDDAVKGDLDHRVTCRGGGVELHKP